MSSGGLIAGAIGAGVILTATTIIAVVCLLKCLKRRKTARDELEKNKNIEAGTENVAFDNINESTVNRIPPPNSFVKGRPSMKQPGDVVVVVKSNNVTNDKKASKRKNTSKTGRLETQPKVIKSALKKPSTNTAYDSASDDISCISNLSQNSSNSSILLPVSTPYDQNNNLKIDLNSVNGFAAKYTNIYNLPSVKNRTESSKINSKLYLTDPTGQGIVDTTKTPQNTTVPLASSSPVQKRVKKKEIQDAINSSSEQQQQQPRDSVFVNEAYQTDSAAINNCKEDDDDDHNDKLKKILRIKSESDARLSFLSSSPDTSSSTTNLGNRQSSHPILTTTSYHGGGGGGGSSSCGSLKRVKFSEPVKSPKILQGPATINGMNAGILKRISKSMPYMPNDNLMQPIFMRRAYRKRRSFGKGVRSAKTLNSNNSRRRSNSSKEKELPSGDRKSFEDNSTSLQSID